MPVSQREKKAYSNSVNRIIKRHTRLEDSTVRRMNTLLSTLERDLRAQLSGVEDFNNLRFQQLADSYNRLIDVFGNQAAALMNDSLRQSWGNGVDMVTDPLEAAGIDAAFFRPSAAQAAMAIDFSADLIQGIADDTRSKVNTQVRLGVLGAKSPFEVMKQITTDMGIPRKASDRAKGVAYRAEMIARTEMNRVYSMATQSSQEEAAKNIPNLKKEWMATADDRTRLSHLSAHGQQVDVDKPFMVGGYPLMFPGDPGGPAGETINCRCTSITIPPDFDRERMPIDDEIEAERQARVEQGVDKVARQAEETKLPLTGAEARALMWDLESKFQREEKALWDEFDRIQKDVIKPLSDLYFKSPSMLSPSELKRFEEADARLGQIIAISENSTFRRDAAMRELLQANNPVNIRVQKAKGTKMAPQWEEGLKWFNQLVDQAAIPTKRGALQPGDMWAKFKVTDDMRAYFQKPYVNLNYLSGERTVVHELGHALEHRSPYIKRKAKQFLNKRTKGEETITMNEAAKTSGYDDYEKTKPDAFMSPYMGKQYSHGSTEIISMGLEYMATKPVDFATNDPEMFDFIYDVVRGNI